MDTLYIISVLLKKQNKTQKELCEYLGLSKQTFTEWKAGRTNSYMKYLLEIGDYFNVSTDYLLGKTDKKKEQTAEMQSDNEDINKLIEIGTKLSSEHLKALLVLAEQLEKGQSEE